MPPTPPGWTLLTDLKLPRLQRRIEAVLLSPGAVLVFGPEAAAAAVDLADFHEGCRDVPVIPIVLVQRERVVAQAVLPLPGAAPTVVCSRLLLPLLMDQVARFPPHPALEPEAWQRAAYRPVPGLMQAACALYAGHDEARLRLASSGRGELARTRAAVEAAVAEALAAGRKRVVFVTGRPGAGKTLCGMDIAFAGRESPAAFVTGNPALLHVLRAALVRDAVRRGHQMRAMRQRVEAVVQPLHAFRDHHLAQPGPPPDRVLVVDEAQRCWTGDFARSKTRNRAVRLTDSEPGHILDIMGRHAGGCAVVCLVGGGQEIHVGEGGLAAWGEALAARPGWDAVAPDTPEGGDARQLLPDLPGLVRDEALHLGEAVRAWRAPRVVGWVEAVLAGAAEAASAIAGADFPVRVTRSLDAMRAALRARWGRTGTVGLVAAAGGRRLRAEGLGGLLWHQDEDAVARWFLDAWPDVRSAAALEVAATEFGVQGLELDHVGVCWDADLVRDEGAWQARAFRGTAWTLSRDADARANRLNAYRVLLTRARQSSVIWVPQGAAADPTRDPRLYDATASYLLECGARPLAAEFGTGAQDRPARTPRGRSPMRHLILAVLLLLAAPLRAAELKLATWNLEWLTLRAKGDPVLPDNVSPKGAAEHALLRRYAAMLDADVVALQEVDGAEAAAQVFPPDRYAIVMTGDAVVQRVGFAIRRGLRFERNPDLVALDVVPNAQYRLRSGADVTLVLPGARVRLLNVHLKSGCNHQRLDPDRGGRACETLARQVPALRGWMAERVREGAPFVLLGDFNRRMEGRDQLLAALNATAPLLRATEGRATPCWGGNSFIDHILAGGAARGWLLPDSLRVLVYREGEAWKERLSDHCPVSVVLRVPD